jgi:hypothetical protein
MKNSFSNLIIYYISGTGNARKSAEWIVGVAKESGINTWLLRQSNVLSGLNHGWREVLYNLVWACSFLVFSFTAYRLIHYMMRFRLFNKLVAYTSLTKYRFWCRYKAPEEY